MTQQTVISVSQLNRYIKALIEENGVLNNVFVTGEISNFKNHYSSGHFYMTLKDESAAVSAVIYRTNAQKIKYDLYDGLYVIVRGRVSLYEKSGQYQIIVDDIQPQGIGELALAFEQLKQKLGEKGFFDPSHKKPIPKYPKRVGIVTSATGAAIRDITNIISRRFPLCEMITYPVEVQGINAAPSISKAIKELNDSNAVDVIIVGRGGGSIEDLWAFNEEKVALAVYNSVIPVISAVGHETDFTICDFVADVRAETPSAAAEICVPDKETELQSIISLKNASERFINFKIQNEKSRLSHLVENRFLTKPEEIINVYRMNLDEKTEDIDLLFKSKLNDSKNEFALILKKLESLNPIKVISRGFAFAQSNGKVVKSVSDVVKGDNITLNVTDGIIDCEVI
ncbi:MAG: exodeoxyribonuclease VII large subunit [Ruminococcaceae bacterium]|jgi:exodeoxyribonuclease VII large subunit|nr:exodeoxyribonuclease VII large subunit [Oscillospiraceae bacterium]